MDDADDGRKSVKISNRNGVPAGEYHLVLGIGGEVALEGKMIVTEQVDDSDSEVSGQVVDARTGRGIDGALVIVLKPRTSMRRFLQARDERDVESSTETKSDGAFTLPTQLPKGQSYSLVIAARGYEPITVEGALRIGPTAPEHADIGQIEMERIYEVKQERSMLFQVGKYIVLVAIAVTGLSTLADPGHCQEGSKIGERVIG